MPLWWDSSSDGQFLKLISHWKKIPQVEDETKQSSVIDFFNQVNFHQRGGGQGHPDALKKLGQKQKRGPQIEPHRLCYFWNRSLLMTEIHLKSNKRCRKWFGRALFSLCVQFFKVFSVETNSYCIRVRGGGGSSQFQLIFWINLISIHLDGIFRSILI